MALKLYPLGIQTFERIRKENKLYIDKTEYVYRLTHTSGTYFFGTSTPLWKIPVSHHPPELL